MAAVRSEAALPRVGMRSPAVFLFGGTPTAAAAASSDVSSAAPGEAAISSASTTTAAPSRLTAAEEVELLSHTTVFVPGVSEAGRARARELERVHRAESTRISMAPDGSSTPGPSSTSTSLDPLSELHDPLGDGELRRGLAAQRRRFDAGLHLAFQVRLLELQGKLDSKSPSARFLKHIESGSPEAFGWTQQYKCAVPSYIAAKKDGVLSRAASRQRLLGAASSRGSPSTTRSRAGTALAETTRLVDTSFDGAASSASFATVSTDISRSPSTNALRTALRDHSAAPPPLEYKSGHGYLTGSQTARETLLQATDTSSGTAAVAVSASSRTLPPHDLAGAEDELDDATPTNATSTSTPVSGGVNVAVARWGGTLERDALAATVVLDATSSSNSSSAGALQVTRTLPLSHSASTTTASATTRPFHLVVSVAAGAKDSMPDVLYSPNKVARPYAPSTFGLSERDKDSTDSAKLDGPFSQSLSYDHLRSSVGVRSSSVRIGPALGVDGEGAAKVEGLDGTASLSAPLVQRLGHLLQDTARGALDLAAFRRAHTQARRAEDAWTRASMAAERGSGFARAAFSSSAPAIAVSGGGIAVSLDGARAASALRAAAAGPRVDVGPGRYFVADGATRAHRPAARYRPVGALNDAERAAHITRHPTDDNPAPWKHARRPPERIVGGPDIGRSSKRDDGFLAAVARAADQPVPPTDSDAAAPLTNHRPALQSTLTTLTRFPDVDCSATSTASGRHPHAQSAWPTSKRFESKEEIGGEGRGARELLRLLADAHFKAAPTRLAHAKEKRRSKKVKGVKDEKTANLPMALSEEEKEARQAARLRVLIEAGLESEVVQVEPSESKDDGGESAADATSNQEEAAVEPAVPSLAMLPATARVSSIELAAQMATFGTLQSTTQSRTNQVVRTKALQDTIAAAAVSSDRQERIGSAGYSLPTLPLLPSRPQAMPPSEPYVHAPLPTSTNGSASDPRVYAASLAQFSPRNQKLIRAARKAELDARMDDALTAHREVVAGRVGVYRQRIASSNAALRQRLSRRQLGSRWFVVLALAARLRVWQRHLDGRRAHLAHLARCDAAARRIQVAWRAHRARVHERRRLRSLRILKRNFGALLFRHRVRKRVRARHLLLAFVRDVIEVRRRDEGMLDNGPRGPPPLTNEASGLDASQNDEEDPAADPSLPSHLRPSPPPRRGTVHSVAAVIRRFRGAVITMQRAVRRFLRARRAQLHVLGLQWEQVVDRQRKVFVDFARRHKTFDATLLADLAAREQRAHAHALQRYEDEVRRMRERRERQEVDETKEEGDDEGEEGDEEEAVSPITASSRSLSPSRLPHSSSPSPSPSSSPRTFDSEVVSAITGGAREQEAPSTGAELSLDPVPIFSGGHKRTPTLAAVVAHLSAASSSAPTPTPPATQSHAGALGPPPPPQLPQIFHWERRLPEGERRAVLLRDWRERRAKHRRATEAHRALEEAYIKDQCRGITAAKRLLRYSDSGSEFGGVSGGGVDGVDGGANVTRASASAAFRALHPVSRFHALLSADQMARLIQTALNNAPPPPPAPSSSSSHPPAPEHASAPAATHTATSVAKRHFRTGTRVSISLPAGVSSAHARTASSSVTGRIPTTPTAGRQSLVATPTRGS